MDRFADYILNAAEGTVHRVRETEVDSIDEFARRAMRGALKGERRGLDLIRSAGEAVMTIADRRDDAMTYTLFRAAPGRDRAPICVVCMLACEGAQADAALAALDSMLRYLSRGASDGHAVGPEGWRGLITDYPCVVTAPLPLDDQHAHMLAGDIVQCLMAAWTEMRA